MRILGFGEILWDLFGENEKIGGAPFNFLSHCARLGSEVQLVSAVGKDDLGKRALKIAESYGVNTDYVPMLRKIPTGYCEVSLDYEGNPFYNLVTDVAYDRIPCPKKLKDNVYDAVYFGSLALRDEESYNSFLKLLEKTEAREYFCDINVRGDFCTGHILKTCLKAATILKFSREEMDVFGQDTLIGTVSSIFSVYENIHTIVVTMGGEGAGCFTRKNRCFVTAPLVEVVSAVGAGDSFSAAFLTNYLSGVSVRECLTRACTLGSYVVTQLEAIPEYPQDLLAQIKP